MKILEVGAFPSFPLKLELAKTFLLAFSALGLPPKPPKKPPLLSVFPNTFPVLLGVVFPKPNVPPLEAVVAEPNPPADPKPGLNRIEMCYINNNEDQSRLILE